MLVTYENKAVKIEDEEGIRYAPVHVIDGFYYHISHQGEVLTYRTEKEALEYFKD